MSKARSLVVDHAAGGMAAFSMDRVYRYRLARTWAPGTIAVFVMLNPSTATADVDDATIRRCCGFAHREGYGGITVVNLFALRTPSPRTLRAHPDPVGPHNDTVLLDAIGAAGLVVAAWGAHGGLHNRDRQVAQLLGAVGAHPVCLGVTATGAPRHPLYTRADAALMPWNPR